MKYREYYDNVLVRIEKGEDVVEKLFELVEKLQLKNGSISGIGASDNITVGLYSVEKQEYTKKISQERWKSRASLEISLL